MLIRIVSTGDFCDLCSFIVIKAINFLVKKCTTSPQGNQMLLKVTALLSAAEEPLSKRNELTQQMLIFHTFAIENPDGRAEWLRRFDLICENHPADSVCDWSVLKCTNGKIKEIRLDRTSEVRLASLEWLPPTVDHIIVNPRNLGISLRTRLLPRDLYYLTMNECSLVGKLALETLPSKLAFFKVSHNVFTGTLYFMDLPRGLVQLEIRGNPISRVYVDKSDIPENMSSLVLPGKKCSVFSVRSRKASMEGRKSMRVRRVYGVQELYFT